MVMMVIVAQNIYSILVSHLSIPNEIPADPYNRAGQKSFEILISVPKRFFLFIRTVSSSCIENFQNLCVQVPNKSVLVGKYSKAMSATYHARALIS